MVSPGVTPAGNNSRSDLPKGGLFCAQAAPVRMPPSVQCFPNSPHVCLRAISADSGSSHTSPGALRPAFGWTLNQVREPGAKR